MGLHLKNIRKLQLVQNAAVQTVLEIPPCPRPRVAYVTVLHMPPWGGGWTPLLWKLQWLLIYFQVQVKVLVIACEALDGLGPEYLQNHLFPNRIGLTHSCWQMGPNANPISWWISAGGIQKKSLLYHGSSWPLENVAPQEVKDPPFLF